MLFLIVSSILGFMALLVKGDESVIIARQTSVSTSATSAGIPIIFLTPNPDDIPVITMGPATSSEPLLPPTGTTLLLPPTFTPSPTPVSSVNKGAVAGGVIGGLAIIVAAIAAFIFLRCRQPKRHGQWKNRYISSGRWIDLEENPKSAGQGHSEALDRQYPFHNRDTKLPIQAGSDQAVDPVSRFDSHPTSPNTPQFDSIPPLLIRDKRRPSTDNPFTDPTPSGHRKSPSGTFHSHAKSISFGSSSPSSDRHNKGGSIGDPGSPISIHGSTFGELKPMHYLVPDMPLPTAS